MRMIEVQGDFYNPVAIAAITRDGDSDEFNIYLYGMDDPLTHAYDSIDECRDEMESVKKAWNMMMEGATHA